MPQLPPKDQEPIESQPPPKDQEAIVPQLPPKDQEVNDWSTRCRMRTMELQGINKAIEILSSPEAVRTFTAARTRRRRAGVPAGHLKKMSALQA